MFYKYINEDTIERAPSLIRTATNNKIVYTNDEKIYNQNKYYKLIEEDRPQDSEYTYEPKYILQGNNIYKKWSIVFKTEPTYWDSDDSVKEEYNEALERDRELILDAWDIYSKNVAYGVYEETEEEHESYIKWYKGICNKEAWAFTEIPTVIRKHMR